MVVVAKVWFLDLIISSKSVKSLTFDVLQEGVISFKDLFKAPTFDELDEVARDNNGNSKFLNDKQLDNIRRLG